MSGEDTIICMSVELVTGALGQATVALPTKVEPISKVFSTGVALGVASDVFAGAVSLLTGGVDDWGDDGALFALCGVSFELVELEQALKDTTSKTPTIQ